MVRIEGHFAVSAAGIILYTARILQKLFYIEFTIQIIYYVSKRISDLKLLQSFHNSAKHVAPLNTRGYDIFPFLNLFFYYKYMNGSVSISTKVPHGNIYNVKRNTEIHRC